jgi:hypothetical protein
MRVRERSGTRKSSKDRNGATKSRTASVVKPFLYVGPTFVITPTANSRNKVPRISADMRGGETAHARQYVRISPTKQISGKTGATSCYLLPG